MSDVVIWHYENLLKQMEEGVKISNLIGSEDIVVTFKIDQINRLINLVNLRCNEIEEIEKRRHHSTKGLKF